MCLLSKSGMFVKKKKLRINHISSSMIKLFVVLIKNGMDNQNLILLDAPDKKG